MRQREAGRFLVIRGKLPPVRSAPEDVTVSFDSNGGTPVDTQTVESNTPAVKPASPAREGFTFVGWYLDYGLERPWDFGRKVPFTLTLYAKWTENTSSGSSSSSTSSYLPRVSVSGDGSIELSSSRPLVGQLCPVRVCTWPKSRSSPPAEKLWSSPKYLRTVTPLYSPGVPSPSPPHSYL